MKKIYNLYKTLDIKVLIKLIASAILAGVVPLLFEPHFKSIYTPEEYGLYDYFLKTFAIIVPFLTLKTDIFILNSTANTSYQKWFNSLCIIIFNSLIIFLFFFTINLFFEFLKIKILFLSIIGAFEFSVILISVNTLLKLGKSTLVSFQKPIRRISELIILLIISYFVTSSYSLITSSLVGLFFAMVFAVKSVLNMRSDYQLKFGINELINYAKQTKDILLSEILNTFSLSFLSIFIFYNYSVTEVGLMELSNKIISIPQILFCGFIAIIIQNKLSNIINENKSIITLVKNYAFILIFISIMFCFTIYFGAKYAIPLFFTKDWWTSISFVNILIIQLSVFIVLSPLSRVLYSLKAYKSYRNWQIVKSLLIIATMLCYKLNIYSFLLVYSITAFFAYLLLLMFIVKEVKNYESSKSYKN